MKVRRVVLEADEDIPCSPEDVLDARPKKKTYRSSRANLVVWYIDREESDDA